MYEAKQTLEQQVYKHSTERQFVLPSRARYKAVECTESNFYYKLTQRKVCQELCSTPRPSGRVHIKISKTELLACTRLGIAQRNWLLWLGPQGALVHWYSAAWGGRAKFLFLFLELNNRARVKELLYSSVDKARRSPQALQIHNATPFGNGS